MKRFFKYIAVAILSSGISSCLDFDPKEQLADGNLWGKPGDFEAAANLFYEWTPGFGLAFNDYIHSDQRSDLIMDKSAKNVYSNGTNTVPASDGDYTNGYKHIYRCNLLLKHSENYSNPDEIRQSVGEAYFFRAWSYFQLVQKYGDVIIVKTPIDVNDPAMNAKRDSRSDVVDFIVDDLNKAAEYLKPTSEVAEGRVGSEGAQAFLSRVALYEGTWQKFRGNESRGVELCGIAADAAKSVIDSKQFELFAPEALGDSAQKYMFILEDVKCNPAGLTKSSNREYIFKRCYDQTLNPNGKNLTKGILCNAQLVSAKFANMYLCSDGLPIEKSPNFKGYETIKSEWENRDNRMRYTLCRPGDFFWSNNNPRIDWSGSKEEIAVSQTVSVNPAAISTGLIPNGGTGYYPQKMATERQVEDRYESYDWPIIRYAEVLLNYAEAVFERDGAISDRDLDISLNLTRQRVNKKMPKLSNSFVTAHGLSMREEIRRERTIELFQEGFRIDDLKRWKTAEVEMPMDFLGIRWTGEWRSKWGNMSLPVNATGNIIYESGRKWEEKNYLYPLPVDELQLNPNLGQNQGWAGI